MRQWFLCFKLKCGTFYRKLFSEANRAAQRGCGSQSHSVNENAPGGGFQDLLIDRWAIQEMRMKIDVSSWLRRDRTTNLWCRYPLAWFMMACKHFPFWPHIWIVAQMFHQSLSKREQVKPKWTLVPPPRMWGAELATLQFTGVSVSVFINFFLTSEWTENRTQCLHWPDVSLIWVREKGLWDSWLKWILPVFWMRYLCPEHLLNQRSAAHRCQKAKNRPSPFSPGQGGWGWREREREIPRPFSCTTLPPVGMPSCFSQLFKKADADLALCWCEHNF